MQRTADIWIFRTKSLPIDDLIGFDVEATDGSIGKIDRATAETDRHFVVVDTGFWIFGKKRLVPAGVIERVDTEQGKVFVTMTKDQVKNAPDFEELQHATYDEKYYDNVGGYYDGFRSL